ncbi:RICIN domain-containing protein [Kitasatospora sp. NPDC051853]|uniref:RICIN domain-containing protein n=1 Tax=Kitasatospora sp. NPDC051853 TaxID=3364058 RepID=UPI0037A004DA
MEKKTVVRLGRTAALVSASVGLVVTMSVPASAQPTDTITSKNTGFCLEIGGWNTANGAKADQWPCGAGGQANQQWLSNGNWGWGWAPLINKHSGKCLEVGGWSTQWGAAVNQWDCGRDEAGRYVQDNQLWKKVWGSDPNYSYIVNKHSGQCLEVGGWSTQWGAAVNQWPCGTDQANQLWF